MSSLQQTWQLFVILFPTLLTTSQAFDVIAVDNAIRAAQACRADTNPALTVSVVRDGKVLLSRGYGIRRPYGKGPVDSSTGFNIASLTKAFTATLLLKVMKDDGRYNLSTKVRDILGNDFRFKDDLRTEEVTVEDLLSHKVSLPANNRMRFDDKLTRANLQHRLRYLDAPDDFRTVYIYSNLMYGLATRMTEVISNRRWEDVLWGHIFRPLAMDDSMTNRDAIFNRDKIAAPVEAYLGQLQNISHELPDFYSELAGSGSIVSTADDMAKWMNMLLHGGQDQDGSQVMPKDVVEDVFKPRTAIPGPNLFSLFRKPEVPATFAFDVYAMGWRRGYYRGYPALGHSGSTFGFRSLLTLIRDLKLGVFTSMTGKDPGYVFRGTLHNFILDSLLGYTPWLNATTMCSFPAPWHGVTPPQTQMPYDTTLPLTYNASAYVGVYENPAYGRMYVRVRTADSPGEAGKDGGEPQAPLTVFYGFATWDLVPLPNSSSTVSVIAPSGAQFFYGKGRKVTAWVDYSPFAFHPPPKGSDVIVEMSVPGFEARTPPVFIRARYHTSGCNVIFAHTLSLLLTLFVVFFAVY